MTHDPIEHLPESTKHLMDALSLGAVVGALAQWLPALAALLSVVWYSIRIYEYWASKRLPKE